MSAADTVKSGTHAPRDGLTISTEPRNPTQVSRERRFSEEIEPDRKIAGEERSRRAPQAVPFSELLLTLRAYDLMATRDACADPLTPRAVVPLKRINNGCRLGFDRVP